MTDAREARAWVNREGCAWCVGEQADVDWIRRHTKVSFAVTSAIPPVFEAYATLELPGSGDRRSASPRDDFSRHEAGVLEVLGEHSQAQAWWIGYLETGASDIVFHNVQKVKPGPNDDGRYVLVEAGPAQAGAWREHDACKGRLPDLMFPGDRSWLFSTLWDDDWSCIGGSRALVDAFLTHPDLGRRTREVDPPLDDSTPPGHTAI